MVIIGIFLWHNLICFMRKSTDANLLIQYANFFHTAKYIKNLMILKGG